MIKNPPNKKYILWPCDLVAVLDSEGQKKEECELYVRQQYSIEEGHYYDSVGVLFPFGGYPVMENGNRYLAKINEINWKNPKIQSMMAQIASSISNINKQGYIYLDFHFSRLFFCEDGELYLNYSNLLFVNSERKKMIKSKDNIIEQGSYPIEFAEPAIVQKIVDQFDYRSQNYSLAAMFFYLMFGRYAYDGKLLDGYSDLNSREHYEKFRDYHKMPIFIFDPEDKSNALGDFEEEQAIITLWNEAPNNIKDMLTKVLSQENSVRKNDTDINPTPEEWIACFKENVWMN